MSTPTKEQPRKTPSRGEQAIAREAQIKIAAMLPSPWIPLGEQQCEAIILAAIEEGYRQGVDDMDRNWREREKLDAAAQPQRSDQPQEWTVEADEFAHDWIRTSDCEHMSSLQRIADAHNAELAAERQRREQAEKDLKCFIANGNKLHQQLLSAQVAIERHNRLFNEQSGMRVTVDLAALQKHDAEVRKPLELKIKELQDEIDRLNAR